MDLATKRILENQIVIMEALAMLTDTSKLTALDLLEEIKNTKTLISFSA